MNTDFARLQMVEQQVRAWDVFDPDVLDVLSSVPREQFVPAGFESLAFADTEIPLGHGESMMTPTVEGRLLQALDLDGTESVLEVGTGSGFLCACLARLADTVVSIDIHDDFLERAAGKLDDTRTANVELLNMDATVQIPDRKFDAIAVTGSMERFEPRFVEALNPGGRLFIIIGKAPTMEARIIEKTADSDWQSEAIFETVLKPLVNGALPAQFSF